MKRKKIILAVVVVLAILSVSQLYAEDEELTLEGLGAQIVALTERVTDIFTAQSDLEKRVAAVETATAPTPTPTPTATPTPGPEVPRLLYDDIERDDDANTFAARKKYSQYEDKIVEIEGEIDTIGIDWDGRGIPYITIGWVPEALCHLEEVEEDVLLQIREGDYVLIRGEFTIWEEIDSYLFIIMNKCQIIFEEETESNQE